MTSSTTHTDAGRDEDFVSEIVKADDYPLAVGVESIRRQLEWWVKYDRDHGGVAVTSDSHVIPPSWPTHGSLANQIYLLKRVEAALSAAPPAPSTEGEELKGFDLDSVADVKDALTRVCSLAARSASGRNVMAIGAISQFVLAAFQRPAVSDEPVASVDLAARGGIRWNARADLEHGALLYAAPQASTVDREGG